MHLKNKTLFKIFAPKALDYNFNLNSIWFLNTRLKRTFCHSSLLFRFLYTSPALFHPSHWFMQIFPQVHQLKNFACPISNLIIIIRLWSFPDHVNIYAEASTSSLPLYLALSPSLCFPGFALHFPTWIFHSCWIFFCVTVFCVNFFSLYKPDYKLSWCIKSTQQQTSKGLLSPNTTLCPFSNLYTKSLIKASFCWLIIFIPLLVIEVALI